MKTMSIVLVSIFGTVILTLALVLGVGWYLFDGPGNDPSLDQQQVAWETESREKACRGYQEIGGDFVAMGQAAEDFKAAGDGEGIDHMRRYLDLSNGNVNVTDLCQGPVFERFAEEAAVDTFWESPKSQVGETAKSSAPR